MGNEGSHRRILNRLRCSYIQFVLRRHRNVIGAVDLIPLRERTALNVTGRCLRRLADRVRSEKAVHDIEGHLEVYWKSPELLVVVDAEQLNGWQQLHDSYLNGYPGRNAMGVIQ